MVRAIFSGGAGRVYIHDHVVQGYIRTGGEVAGLLDDVARDAAMYSRRYVSAGHVRSGRLLRGIKWARTQPTGPLQGKARTSSAAKHTIFFHDGTRAVINGNPHMVVPKNRHAAHTNLAFSGAGAQKLAEWGKKSTKQKARGKGVMRKDEVRGQRSKPFLSEGLAYGLLKQRLI